MSPTFNSRVTLSFVQLSVIYWLFFPLIFLHTCVRSSSSPSSSLPSSPGLILDWSLSRLYPGNLSPPVCKKPIVLWSSTHFRLVLCSPLANFFSRFSSLSLLLFSPPSVHLFHPSYQAACCLYKFSKVEGGIVWGPLYLRKIKKEEQLACESHRLR